MKITGYFLRIICQRFYLLSLSKYNKGFHGFQIPTIKVDVLK